MSLLTVKHIEMNGHESIQMAHSVSYDRGGVKVEGSNEESRPALIAFGCTGSGGAVDQFGVCHYGSGTVFVMNDSGATVGKYIF